MRLQEYDLEILGANNTFQVHVAIEPFPLSLHDEDSGEWYDLKSVMLKHGNRQREVVHLITDEQYQQIKDGIEKYDKVLYHEWMEYLSEAKEYENANY